MSWQPFVPLSDESVQWQSFRKGDRQAFSGIFNNYYQTLYNYGMKVIVNECLVEDCIQDLFFDLWRTRESLTDQIGSVRFYLMQCLRRRILRTKELEKRNKQAFPEATVYEEPCVHSPEWIHTENDMQHQTRRVLSLLIDELPDRQREVMYLRFFCEMSLEEIALMMSINKQSVKNMIYRSVNSLRGNPAITHVFYSLLLLTSLFLLIDQL